MLWNEALKHGTYILQNLDVFTPKSWFQNEFSVIWYADLLPVLFVTYLFDTFDLFDLEIKLILFATGKAQQKEPVDEHLPLFLWKK